jgi:hypothetical protein
VDEVDTLAGSECTVATAMALQIPNHVTHEWAALLDMRFLAALVLSKSFMLGGHPLGGQVIDLESLDISMGQSWWSRNKCTIFPLVNQNSQETSNIIFSLQFQSYCFQFENHLINIFLSWRKEKSIININNADHSIGHK